MGLEVNNGSSGARIHYAFVVAIVGALMNLGALGFGRFAYSLILPSMKEGLVLTYGQTGLIVTGTFIGYTLGAAISGLMAARYGPRLVIVVAMTLCGLGMVVTGVG